MEQWISVEYSDRNMWTTSRGDPEYSCQEKLKMESSPSESFLLPTFQFSLGMVCLALQKFNKAQTSHRHATDMSPTCHRRILYVISLKSGQRVGRLSVHSWPTVGRLSTDCRLTVSWLSVDSQPTRWPTCRPTCRWGRILTFTKLSVYLLGFNFFSCASLVTSLEC